MHLGLIVRTLLGHWRRRPYQGLSLLLGLAVATALWSGVQALNQEARNSYDRAAALLGADRFAAITAAGGVPMAEADYVALRRAGWRVSPVIEGQILVGERLVRLIGIEPLTLPPEALGGAAIEGAAGIANFLAPPYQLFGGPGTAALLEGADFPPVEEVSDMPPGTVLGDIGYVQERLALPGQITRLVVAEGQKPGRVPLAEATETRLILSEPGTQSDLGSLTDSFHLNLTAFGLLSFVVGLFIVHATIGLAFEQRRPLLRTLRALGVSQREVMVALIAELVLLATLAGLVGIVLGYFIAAALLPDVAASLGGLYGAAVPGSLSLSPLWWLLGLGISLAGALIAAFTSFWKARTLKILEPVGAQAWLGAEARQLRTQRVLALGLLVVTVAVYVLRRDLIGGFALMGGALIAAALLLPSLIAGLLRLLAARASNPMRAWFWADTRAQLGGLSLALMALLLALAVNIGVGTMVDGFRKTFLSYLDQRLASEIYVRGTSDVEAAEIAAYLEERDEVTAILPIWNVDIRHRDWPVSLYGIKDHATYRQNWPILDALPDPWVRLASGEATLISEQFARRFGIVPGDVLTIPSPRDDWRLAVAGIYADYGNTTGQMMVALPGLLDRWPNVEKRRYGVRVSEEEAAALTADLVSDLSLGEGQVIDQADLKALSRRIFETTFAVTVALNALTLAVAGLALLTSLLTLSAMRLPQLAPAWAMGLPRATLGRWELWRTLALAFVTALAAIPLGLVVAWILTAIINVEAFGWRLPLFLFPGQWVQLTALALLTAALASALPVWRLMRLPPVKLLRLFSDER